MTNRPIRIYADTSVYGGVEDKEFSKPSREFFNQVKTGKFTLVISPLVQQELATSPERIRGFVEGILPLVEIASVNPEALELRDAYVKAGIVQPKSQTDAFHVALATVSNCRAIVSWNFLHIVNFRRIPLYNAINKVHG